MVEGNNLVMVYKENSTESVAVWSSNLLQPGSLVRLSPRPTFSTSAGVLISGFSGSLFTVFSFEGTTPGVRDVYMNSVLGPTSATRKISPNGTNTFFLSVIPNPQLLLLSLNTSSMAINLDGTNAKLLSRPQVFEFDFI